LTPLMQTPSLIIIDEIQRRPDLFPVLRVLVDTYPHSKLLILGSASRELIKQSSETLAGRIGYIELVPFSLQDTDNCSQLWLRGGFPRAYLAQSDEDSMLWRTSYIRTFLERDIPALGFNVPAPQVYRFWLMLTHYHGQTMNFSDIARSLNSTDYTIRKYLDILTGTFMTRTLSPWFENISKRQVKAPKIYFRDSGILHTLNGISTAQQLAIHPRLGASWEGFALEEIIRAYALPAEECFFWGTQSGAELDLLIHHKGKRLGFEFKYTDSPKRTASMHIAFTDIGLDHLYVIHPGLGSFPLSETITACGLETFIAKMHATNAQAAL
ncbi:MAG: ATP-binding protein, partial [bacterium]